MTGGPRVPLTSARTRATQGRGLWGVCGTARGIYNLKTHGNSGELVLAFALESLLNPPLVPDLAECPRPRTVSTVSLSALDRPEINRSAEASPRFP